VDEGLVFCLLGEFFYSVSQSYKGSYVDGAPNAKMAEATFADGRFARLLVCVFFQREIVFSKFTGSFKNGLMDKGELVCHDGATVSGKFRNGQWLSGKGSFTPVDSDVVFEGQVCRIQPSRAFKR
jgi:hypothetical protein